MVDTRLYELAEQYGCDKLFNHSYIGHYQTIFHGRNVKRLLEIGIGFRDLMLPFVPFYRHGASLLMWEEYFPEAEIFGCDLREDTLVNEGRIRSAVCDQSKPDDLKWMWNHFGGDFQIVIEDGSHLYEHQRITARTLLPLMEKDSLYVIEDAYPDTAEALAREFGGRLILGNKRPDDCLVVFEL